MEKKLHPSVQQFKEFVKNNPHLVKEVRQGTSSWQELFEEWYLLGEDDSRWESLQTDDEGKNDSTESKKEEADIVGLIWNRIKKMDPEQLQSNISSISEAIGTFQGILSQFQGSKGGQKSGNEAKPNPFSFRKD